MKQTKSFRLLENGDIPTNRILFGDFIKQLKPHLENVPLEHNLYIHATYLPGGEDLVLEIEIEYEDGK